MTISPLDLILLLGALQGFILSTLLWITPKGRRLSNRLLSVLIGLLALMSLALAIPPYNRWVVFALDFLPLIMAMPLGPLVYFYTRSMLDPAFRLGRREQRHFYPVVLDWGAKIIGLVFLGGVLLGLVPTSDGPLWGHVMNEYDTYADIPRWLSVTTYLILTRRFLSQYKLAGNHLTAEHQHQNRRWLWQFINVFLAFQVIWLVHLVPYIIPDTRSALLDKFGWYPIYIPIAVLIYWLGLKGYIHTRQSPIAAPKVSATSIPDEAVRKAIDLLTQAMQTNKLYLDPELTVEKVARHVQLPPKTVSFVMNQHLGKSFNAFVNEYRIEAVKQQLISPVSQHLTLTGIAFECGFNSQATFQRAFKQLTGISPGEYASQQKNSSQIRI
ncbi:helix-turn-helix transcriptional regulator [Spirosoma sp.]|uniref:helix-turn-helix domain-containing protein n=1 Tax=Spirosoma sp. TaxID=1899569 RepID=UPI00261FA887|nr:helix-turn-helix transcriptional regulator [Spirosoma sp.]MCX6214667.1 helix-turn-helix transcriptional regulator [Spirosoma sp.]